MKTPFYKSLLLNRPLLWNTRIVQMLLLALFAHIIYFIIGYGSVHSIRFISNGYLNNFSEELILHFSTGVILFITVVIWLFWFLRNNPFKSFYPIKRSYLAFEFSIIFIIFFSLITIFNTFYYAQNLKLKNLTKDCNLVEDAEIVNMASCFLPYESIFFEKSNSCEAERIKDSIDALYPYDPSLCEKENNVSYPNYESNDLSYLNYCQVRISQFSNEYDSRFYHETSKRWLIGHKKDSIRNILNKYIEIADKYRIRHALNANELTEYCFDDSNYKVSFTLENYYPYGNSDINNISSNSAEFGNLNSAIGEVQQIRSKNFFNISEWEIIFYIALVLSLALFSFRITRFKPWIISVLGFGVLSIIAGIINGIFNSEELILFLIIIFTIFCFVISIINIRRQNNKLFTGLFLIWSSILLGIQLPSILRITQNNTRAISECVNNHWVIIRPEHPFNIWISNNWDMINAMNIIFIFLMMFFYLIPMAYKWQANPAE